MGVADKDNLVNKASDSTTDERPGPVDPVVGPGPAHDSRPKCHSGVHGRSREGPTQQNVSADNETNGDGSNNSQITLLGVNGSCVDRVHQTEGHHDLQHQGVANSNSSGESECWNSLRCVTPEQTLTISYYSSLIN